MAVIRGNNQGNGIYGGDEDDRLVGNGGDDAISGGDGADKLFGGDDNDAFYYSHYSSGDIDLIYGGNGEDRAAFFLSGETEAIYASVDAGIVRVGSQIVLRLDSVEYFSSFAMGLGNDRFAGGAGRDYGNGGGGNDTMLGMDGSDFLYGDAGDDYLSGDAGTDILDGSYGKDVLRGGDGDDQLNGGADSDRLTGGLGRDILTGEGGHDRFIWNSLAEAGDRITDFQSAQDVLLFDSAAFGGITTVDASNFVANSAGVAQDADDRFIYSISTHGLFYDADGNGSGAKVLIAHLTGSSATAADIMMV
jgi:Ca2+-binding RTX toxin-like protein